MGLDAASSPVLLSPSTLAPLSISDLHPALSEPVLSSMDFLNEVTSRYPEAISFAPGRPHEQFFEGMDPGLLVRRYQDHLRATGSTPREAQRSVLQYGPAAGIINDMLARALGREQGLAVTSEDLVVTVGAQEGIFLSLLVLSGPDRGPVLVTDPCYVGTSGAARLLGLDLVPVAADEGASAPRPDALRAVVADLRRDGRPPRVLYTIPDFANPGGYTMTIDERRVLIATARELGLLIIEDSPYAFTAPRAERIPTLKALDDPASPCVVHIGTFAKTGLPGARVGYVVADQRVTGPARESTLAAQIATAKSMVTLNTSPIGQAVVGGLLLELEEQDKMLGEDRGAFYRTSLAHLLSALETEFGQHPRLRGRVRWNRPEGGFFVVLTCDFPVPEELLEVSGRDFCVLWTPMSHFKLDDDPAVRHQLRLACSYLSEEQIDLGVERLARFLDCAAGTQGTAADA